VIELISGQIVRDERQGGYQTQAIPVQEFGIETADAAADAEPAQVYQPEPPSAAEPEPPAQTGATMWRRPLPEPEDAKQ
jgi:cell division transport system ATP-binding protein